MDKNIRNFIRYISLERRYSPRTVTAYTNDLQQFETFVKDYFNTTNVFWNRVDKKIIRYFMIHLQEAQLSRRSIARKMATLKSFFKYLAREEIIDHNPTLSIKMPKFEQKLPEYLSEAEIEAMLKLPQLDNFESIRDLAILELFYGTGIRLSELINLTMDQILQDL